MMELHLIRHGKTLANEQRLYCGQTDLPLSDSGAAEILELKNHGIYPPGADLYFTSGLVRTTQTLELLCGPVPQEALPQLGEYRFGSFEMKSHDELNSLAEYQNWIMDDKGVTPCPGGESRLSFGCRVKAGYEVLLARAHGVKNHGRQTEYSNTPKATILVVCHGGVITYVMEELFPGRYNFYEWQPAPGRGYTIMYAEGGVVSYTKI